MRLELATQKDFDAIITFYDDVTERTPEMAVGDSDANRVIIRPDRPI